MYVYENSYAHEYVEENNNIYKLIDPYILGDANDDGYIDIIDVTHIQFAVANLITLDENQQKAADVDKDGILSVNDVTTLQFFVAKIIDEL